MPLDNPEEVGSFVDVKGNRVFYRKAGAGEPILLLHGFPTSSYDWRKLIAPLSKLGLVIAPDLYGFGYSDIPKGSAPTVAKLFPFIDDFVSMMKMEQFRLVAYDWGGMLALRYAAGNPVSVSKLVVMNTSIYPDWIDHVKRSPAYSQVRRMADSGLYRTLAGSFISPGQVKHLIAPRQETVLTPEELGQYVFFVKRAIKNMATLCSKDSLSLIQKGTDKLLSRVRALEMPTLLVSGTNDPFIPSGTGGRLNQDIKGSKLVTLENTGHFLLEEKPTEVANMVSDFLG
ncbi:MAG: alpha/beta hydrolase [Thaumarchaeota archaeon]|nr:alpha/beta hydrolase [Nitrososphaerota archaeon]